MELSLPEILVLMLLWSSVHVKGVRQYGRCKVYNAGEYIDPSRCKLCITEKYEEGFIYCREYDCQPNDCEDKAVTSPSQCCASCPGTCNYGGHVYAMNELFSCLDGVNNCQCIGTGLVRSTRKMYYKENMCDTHDMILQQQIPWH